MTGTIHHRCAATALLVAASVLLTGLLTGCGAGSRTAAPAATTPPTQTPSPSPSPTPTLTTTSTATPTGPSGETPVTRRGALGGCPVTSTVTALAGDTMEEVAKPEAPLICSYTSRRTAAYAGATTPVVLLSVAEPVAVSGRHSLSGYRRGSSRNNATALVGGLGAGAFVSFVADAPELCAVWFTAGDGKILTSSALVVPSGKAGAAGPNSAACSVARRFAGAFD